MTQMDFWVIFLAVFYVAGWVVVWLEAQECFESDPDRLGVHLACLVIASSWPIHATATLVAKVMTDAARVLCRLRRQR